MKFNKKWLKYVYVAAALIFLGLILLLHYYRTTASFAPPGKQQPHRVTPMFGPHADRGASSYKREGNDLAKIETAAESGIEEGLSWWQAGWHYVKSWFSRWGASDRKASATKDQRRVRSRVEEERRIKVVQKKQAQSPLPAKAQQSRTSSKPIEKQSDASGRSVALPDYVRMKSRTMKLEPSSAAKSAKNSPAATADRAQPATGKLQQLPPRDVTTTDRREVVASGRKKTSPLLTGANKAVASRQPVVRVAQVQTKPMFRYADAVGTLKAKQNVTISPEIAGRIVSINFKPGQFVKKGSVLLRLDDRIYRANLKAAQGALLLSRSNYERYHKLAPSGAVSSQQVQQVLSQYKQDKAKVTANQAYLEQTEIVAPFAGHVGMINIDAGSYVDKGAAITDLIDRSSLTVVYLLPEKYRTMVESGQTVQVKLGADSLVPGAAAAGEAKVAGHVTYIAGQSDLTTHSFTVQAQIDNAHNQFVPGAFVQVRQRVGGDEHALVIPEASITPTLAGMQVYRVLAGKVYVTPVTVGERHGHWVQIKSGLRLGDVVVTAGQANLKNGMLVKVLPKDVPPIVTH